MCLKAHTLNVSDLAWTTDSATLLSGSYDETCKTWDIQTGKLVCSTETEGFVQCVAWDFMGKTEREKAYILHAAYVLTVRGIVSNRKLRILLWHVS